MTKIPSKRKPEKNSLEAGFLRGCFFATAGWWVAIGLVMFLAAFDDTLLEHERMFQWPDALFEISTRKVLFMAGGFHLLIGGILFMIQNSLTKIVMVMWGCSVCVIYRLGFGWLGSDRFPAGASCPVVVLTADKVGIKPKLFGLGWGMILGGMVLGALLQLALEWRRRKRREQAAFVERWRDTHSEGGPRTG